MQPYVFSEKFDEAMENWYYGKNNKTRYLIISTIAKNRGIEVGTFGHFLVTKAVGYTCRNLTAEQMADIFIKCIYRIKLSNNDLNEFFSIDDNVKSFVELVKNEAELY